MKILITGGTGFLGSHLIPRLVAESHDVVVLKRVCSSTKRLEEVLSRVTVVDMDRSDIDELFRREAVEAVIHLATDFGRPRQDALRMAEANLLLPVRLLDLCVKYGCSSFINSHTSLPADYNLYSAMKSSALGLVRYYSARHAVNVVNMVMDYLYGEGDDVSKFVPYAVESIIARKVVDMTGGEQKRDFVYVGDAVSAFMAAIDRVGSLKGRFVDFPVITRIRTRLLDVVKLIENASGVEAVVNAGKIPYIAGEIFDNNDGSDAENAFGWKPDVALKEGLSRVVRWHQGRFSSNARGGASQGETGKL